MYEDVIIQAQLFRASSSGLYLAESCRFKSQPVLYFITIVYFVLHVFTLWFYLSRPHRSSYDGGHLFLINLQQHLY